MKNKKLSSEEIKQIELNLIKLDEICKKYKLRYYSVEEHFWCSPS